MKISKKAILLSIVALFFITAIGLILSNLMNKNNIFTLSEKEVRKTEQEQNVPKLTTIASNLEIPWALAFFPDGNILFTERPGKVKLVDREGKRAPILVAEIPEVKPVGEGGLLGISLHPNFENNRYVYLYYTYSNNADNTLNRVVRFKFENNKLINEQVIIDKIPGAVNHNGGRIKFGPDGYLYITTGDAQNPSLAQDVTSLAGKILRVTDEGKPAPENPFGNLVYSYGHRNPQGLAWDIKGRLWETEHGSSATDELNFIESSKNYGWPTIRGDQKLKGMVSPVLQSGSETWAPSGAVYFGSSIYFAGLRGEALFEAKLFNGQVELKKHLKGEFGRIREVVLGPDDSLYLATSNRDGRGNPKADDDKILRVNPKNF